VRAGREQIVYADFPAGVPIPGTNSLFPSGTEIDRIVGDGTVQTIATKAEDTDGVTPMSHVLDEVTLERADEPADGLARPSALANAPEAAPEAGLFKVPRVVG